MSQKPPRRIAGCIPINSKGQVLLVTSRRHPEWILPKGGIEENESAGEAAVREAWEEAGVRGTLGDLILENEPYYSKRRDRMCLISFYELHVTEIVDDWDEDHQRERKWYSATNALEMVEKPPMKKAMGKFLAK